MNATQKTPQEGEVWKHYKGGEYRIRAIAFAGDEKLPDRFVVVYQNLKDGIIYYRSLDDFLGEGVDDSGEKVPRFACVLAQIRVCVRPNRGRNN